MNDRGVSTGLILAIAAVCGVGAFVWTLVARSPGSDAAFGPAMQGRSGNRFAAGALRMEEEPEDLGALERFVKENQGTSWSWVKLATRRAGAGDEAGAEEAWREVARRADAELRRNADETRSMYCLAYASGKLGDHETERNLYVRAEPRYAPLLANHGGDITRLVRLGWVCHGLGNDGGARQAWGRGAELLEAGPPELLEARDWYNLACFRSLLGRSGPALEALTHAAEKGYTDANWAKGDDDLAAVRGDPVFGMLIHKIEMQATRP